MKINRIASDIAKIASSLVAYGDIKEGDVCTVNVRMVKIDDMGAGHYMRILRDVIRQGGGKVVVEKIRGDRADVYAYDNPMSRIMGGIVAVDVDALTKVGSRAAKDVSASVWKANKAGVDAALHYEIVQSGHIYILVEVYFAGQEGIPLNPLLVGGTAAAVGWWFENYNRLLARGERKPAIEKWELVAYSSNASEIRRKYLHEWVGQ